MNRKVNIKPNLDDFHNLIDNFEKKHKKADFLNKILCLLLEYFKFKIEDKSFVESLHYLHDNKEDKLQLVIEVYNRIYKDRDEFKKEVYKLTKEEKEKVLNRIKGLVLAINNRIKDIGEDKNPSGFHLRLYGKMFYLWSELLEKQEENRFDIQVQEESIISLEWKQDIDKFNLKNKHVNDKNIQEIKEETKAAVTEEIKPAIESLETRIEGLEEKGKPLHSKLYNKACNFFKGIGRKLKREKWERKVVYGTGNTEIGKRLLEPDYLILKDQGKAPEEAPLKSEDRIGYKKGSKLGKKWEKWEKKRAKRAKKKR